MAARFVHTVRMFSFHKSAISFKILRALLPLHMHAPRAVVHVIG